MKEFDITILTDPRWIDPKEPDWYSDQVLREDQLLFDAFERNGLRATRVSWDDQSFDWSTTKFAVFRTVWDYSERWAEFDQWFEKTKNLTQFINPAEQIRWNLDKHYLADLEKQGVNIPPTLFIDRGSSHSLESMFNDTGWNEAVLKPTISGGGRETYRLKNEDVSDFEQEFSRLVASEDMMLQEFQHNIVSRGEVSLMFAGNDITHAIIKNAKEGDFRVQDDFGGKVREYQPTLEDLKFAKNVLSACKNPPILGRVDMSWDNQGNHVLGELEIIEPEMWFRFEPKAADAAAKAIVGRFFS